MDDIELLTVRDLAAALKCKESWVYDRLQDGTIPSLKIGGHRRFRRSDIAAWLDGCRENAPAQPTQLRGIA